MIGVHVPWIEQSKFFNPEDQSPNYLVSVCSEVKTEIYSLLYSSNSPEYGERIYSHSCFAPASST